MKKFKNQNITISFEENAVLHYIKTHLKKQKLETGGIICGYYTEDKTGAVITEFCKPTKDSVFSMMGFIRGVLGLKDDLKKKWSKGTYYLGDWHLHPYSSPCASGQDISQLIQNSKDKSLNCPEPIMIIIGGKNNDEFKVYTCFNGNVEECSEFL